MNNYYIGAIRIVVEGASLQPANAVVVFEHDENPAEIPNVGQDVNELRILLNHNGETVNVEGIFGNETLRAVMDFQSKSHR